MQTSAWLKQTDVFKQAHIVAALIAIYGQRALFFDCRIDQRLTQQAWEGGNIRRFFNRRFHDKGVHWQRLVYFQTTSTKRGGDGKRKRGLANLHVHALIVIPERQSLKQIREELAKVFGRAPGMGDLIQFKHVKPDWTKQSTFNGVTAKGPIGKILYVQQGMGGTYNDLDLNNGKRSRKAPIERLRCTRHAKRLAQGVPSHFNAKATSCDHVSTRAGELAFTEWLREGRETQREEKLRQARASRLAADAIADRLQKPKPFPAKMKSVAKDSAILPFNLKGVAP